MKKMIFSIFVCILFLITSFSVAAIYKPIYDKKEEDTQTSSYIMIKTNDASNIASQLYSEGFDVLYDKVTDTSLELIVTPQELSILQEKGFDFEIISKGRPFIEIQKERQENIQSESIPPGYLDHEEIIQELYDIESSYPSICKVYELTSKYEIGTTYEGRHIYAMKISDNVIEDEDEPNFLMVSCHHAREIITPVIALYAIEQLTTEYGTNPDITTAVDEYEIWIAPVWNPDGYDYCYYVDNWWRKNQNPPDGVDLNRNYPFGWYSGCSGSTDPYSETYKGSGPASEVETQTMIAFTNDRHFSKVIDYHSYGREVLYGYCCHSHPFDSFFYSEAVSLSNAAGYYGSVRPPSCEGEHYEWQIWRNGTYANLMETHIEFQPSYSSAQAEAALVWPGTLWLLQRPISVSGNIVDSITGEPLYMPIDLVGVSFSNEEEFFNEPAFGRYHLFLPPGTYNLEFSYENYHTQTHQVTVTSTSSEVLDIELERLNEPPEKPTIEGTTAGTKGDILEFTFYSTDPDEDDLEYYIKWGDGNIEDWIGPYESGEDVDLDHIWSEPGSYQIQAKVKDTYGEESDYEEFYITIEPKSRIILSLFNFVNSFIQRIIQLLSL